MNGKIKLNVREHGGVFSKVMGIIQFIEKNNLDVNDCYFDILDEKVLNHEKFNPINYILNQEISDEFEELDIDYTKSYSVYDKINESPNFENLKSVVNKLRYNEDFLKLVSDYEEKFSINDETIGIHIRLSDMNVKHVKEYGTRTFDDFLVELNKEVSDKSKIFVASDNVESITKLKKIFKESITYVPNLLRVNGENDNSYQLQIDNFSKKELWVESFLEMMLLSKCSKLVCRTSNLANMAIISSSTIKKIIMI